MREMPRVTAPFAETDILIRSVSIAAAESGKPSGSGI
jgi:hypothetical protein